MYIRAPWSFIPVEGLVSIAADIVGEIASCTQTNQVCIIRRRADRDSFSRPTLKVAQIMGDLFKIVGAKFVGVFDLIEQDDVVRRSSLPRISRCSRL